MSDNMDESINEEAPDAGAEVGFSLHKAAESFDAKKSNKADKIFDANRDQNKGGIPKTPTKTANDAEEMRIKLLELVTKEIKSREKERLELTRNINDLRARHELLSRKGSLRLE